MVSRIFIIIPAVQIRVRPCDRLFVVTDTARAVHFHFSRTITVERVSPGVSFGRLSFEVGASTLEV